MFRKLASLSIAMIVVGSVMIAAPADAAVKISNGVACKKSGTTTKTSGGTYLCTTNPLSTSKKLTWLSSDCVSTGATYRQTQAKLPSIKVSTDQTIAELDAEIIIQQKTLATTLSEIEGYRAKIIGINSKLSPLKADVANAQRNSATIKAYETAIKSYETAITAKSRITSATGTITRSITRIQSARVQALAAYTGAQNDVKDGLEMTKLICTKGF